MNIHLLLFIVVLSSPFNSTVAFESDELLTNDDEFEGVVINPFLSPPSPIHHHRKPDLDSPSSSDSNAIQFDLEHAFGDSDFSTAGTFTARLKSWTHGGQTLTKMRFSRNALTGAEREAFERLLREDDFYTIRVPSTVLKSPGKDYVVSSIRARCIPRESLDEHFIIHTGLVESLKLHVPRADVRFCVRHLYANFKDKYKGLILKRLLWKAAGSYTVEGHVNAMDEIRSLNVEAYEYLEAIEKPLWVRSYFNTSPKCDMLTNNISEAFNKFILAARDKPILTMLEMIRRLLMSRFEKKRTAAQSSQSHGRKIVEKLKSMADGARNCQPYLAGHDLFEVVEKDKQFVVNLNNSTCTCRQWVMTGIPCRHAVCCIQYRRLKTEDFVHEYYSKERYMLAYQEMIYPITDQSTWEKQQCLNILPLKLRRQPGRPKKARNKAADESPKKHAMSKKGTIVRCSNCKQIGHNVRKCKNEATIKKNENVRNEATIKKKENVRNEATIKKKENKKRDKPESSKNQPSSQQASTRGSSVTNVEFSQQSNTGPPTMNTRSKKMRKTI